jgi:hypothetical protein
MSYTISRIPTNRVELSEELEHALTAKIEDECHTVDCENPEVCAAFRASQGEEQWTVFHFRNGPDWGAPGSMLCRFNDDGATQVFHPPMIQEEVTVNGVRLALSPQITLTYSWYLKASEYEADYCAYLKDAFENGKWFDLNVGAHFVW